MSTFRKQRGISMLGGMVIAIMSGVLIITALKLFPLYLEYYNILGVIEQIKADPTLKGVPKEKILSSFSKRLDLGEVRNMTPENYRLTKIQGRNAYTLEFYYEVRRPLFGNLSIVAEFERSEEVGG